MRNDPDAIMIFAAGFGRRMAPLTDTRPKPLIEVAGKPLLDHALDLIDEANISKRVVNAHYKSDQIVDHLAGRSASVSVETPDLLDTGGGLKNALPLLGDGPVFTLNSDIIWAGGNPLIALADQWDSTRMEALLLLVPLEQTHGRKGGGDFAVDSRGHISRKGDLVYTGAQIIKTEALGAILDPVFSLNMLWDRFIKSKSAFGALYGGEWCDIGHPEGIKIAEDLLEDGHV